MSSALGTTNLELLLRAAEYIDRKDREVDHGYAMTAFSAHSNHRRAAFLKTLSSRNAHNELEKTRRAYLHVCLEKLKSAVPLTSKSSRHTMLGLLVNARRLILQLQSSESFLMSSREQLIREQGRLRRRLDMWQRHRASHRDSEGSSRHTLSESSSTSTSSSPADSDFYEQDEVDVVFCDDLAVDIEEIDLEVENS